MLAHNKHIDLSQLVSYHKGLLSHEDMHNLEKHLLDCELCSDALEGIQNTKSNFGLEDDVEILKSRVLNRVGEQRRRGYFIRPLSIAASIAVLLTLGIYYFYEPSVEKPILSEKNQETVEQPQEPEVDTAAQKKFEATDIDSSRFLVAETKSVKEILKNEDSPMEAEQSFSSPPDLQNMEMADAVSDATSEEIIEFADATNEQVQIEEVEEVEQEAFKASNPTRTINGKVVTASGEPVPFAQVIDLANSTGTTSDFEGNFKLEVDSASNQLVANSIGFQQTSIPIDSSNQVQIILNEDAVALSEVVVSESKMSRPKVFTAASTNKEKSPNKGTKEMAKHLNQMDKYIKKNLNYPKAAKESNISGTVMLSFNTDTEGKPIQVKVIRSLGYGCDEEAIRLIKEGPTWQPSSLQLSYGVVFNE